jgi:hypothetical protein
LDDAVEMTVQSFYHLRKVKWGTLGTRPPHCMPLPITPWLVTFLLIRWKHSLYLPRLWRWQEQHISSFIGLDLNFLKLAASFYCLCARTLPLSLSLSIFLGFLFTETTLKLPHFIFHCPWTHDWDFKCISCQHSLAKKEKSMIDCNALPNPWGEKRCLIVHLLLSFQVLFQGLLQYLPVLFFYKHFLYQQCPTVFSDQWLLCWLVSSEPERRVSCISLELKRHEMTLKELHPCSSCSQKPSGQLPKNIAHII